MEAVEFEGVTVQDGHAVQDIIVSPDHLYIYVMTDTKVGSENSPL